jgi:hypothetical protein
MPSFGEPVEREFYDENDLSGTTYAADTDGFVYAFVQDTSNIGTPNNDEAELLGYAFDGAPHEIDFSDICRAHNDYQGRVLATIFMPVLKSENWTVMKYFDGGTDVHSGVFWIPMTA